MIQGFSGNGTSMAIFRRAVQNTLLRGRQDSLDKELLRSGFVAHDRSPHASSWVTKLLTTAPTCNDAEQLSKHRSSLRFHWASTQWSYGSTRGREWEWVGKGWGTDAGNFSERRGPLPERTLPREGLDLGFVALSALELDNWCGRQQLIGFRYAKQSTHTHPPLMRAHIHTPWPNAILSKPLRLMDLWSAWVAWPDWPLLITTHKQDVCICTMKSNGWYHF